MIASYGSPTRVVAQGGFLRQVFPPAVCSLLFFVNLGGGLLESAKTLSFLGDTRMARDFFDGLPWRHRNRVDRLNSTPDGRGEISPAELERQEKPPKFATPRPQGGPRRETVVRLRPDGGATIKERAG